MTAQESPTTQHPIPELEVVRESQEPPVVGEQAPAVGDVGSRGPALEIEATMDASLGASGPSRSGSNGVGPSSSPT